MWSFCCDESDLDVFDSDDYFDDEFVLYDMDSDDDVMFCFCDLVSLIEARIASLSKS